jgi:glutamate--cysteine ligase catalytic subunit
MSLVYSFLDTLEVDAGELSEIKRYLDLVKRRSTGSLSTAATFIRNFVRAHPAYKRDSVVSQEINYDLMVTVDKMYVSGFVHLQKIAHISHSERGIQPAPGFLPDDYATHRPVVCV